MSKEHRALKMQQNTLAKTELSILFEKNIPLRAIYLLSRNQYSTEEPFDHVELSIFLIHFLLDYQNSFAAPIVIEESIMRMLFGSSEFELNLLASLIKTKYYEKSEFRQQVSFNEFYYLRFLPTNKLCHLIGKKEVTKISELYVSSILEEDKHGYLENLKYKRLTGLSSIFDNMSMPALSRFIDLGADASSKENSVTAITIFGLHRSLMGLGEDARRMFDMLTELGYRVELFDCSPTGLERHETADFYEMFETKIPSAKVAIFCLPVFEMARLLPKLTPEFFQTRYIIGYWPWELTSFPTGWSDIFEYADEIWASSTFLHRVYCRSCKKPVYLIPLCVEVGIRRDSDFAKDYVGGNQKTFISVFDFNSTINRKNPVGSIRAFKRAFNRSAFDARLLLKSIHGEMNKNDFDLVLREIGEDSRITLIDGAISRAQLDSLILGSTAFLSLHRSEGFGRLLVESMLLGTPVIATDWSGSTDFIKSDSAFPVRCRLRAVEASEYPYAAGEWAEPDLEDAAEIMRLVAEDFGNRTNVARKGYNFAQAAFSRQAVKSKITERMNSICRNKHYFDSDTAA